MDEENLINKTHYAALLVERKMLYSGFLQRDVVIDIYLPANASAIIKCELLLINDGQDLLKMDFANVLNELIVSKNIRPIVCVGIYCSADRMNEYGTVCQPDYKGRGAKAGLYSNFIFNELLPFITWETGITDFAAKSFAGFSLGGLSAIDIAWNYPDEFSKVGVFSGSLWWRRHGYDDNNYNEQQDRIMHRQVRQGSYHPGLRFFFECGQLDETADRNNNGIIDSIEDTTDLVKDLKAIGYTDKDICYLELEDGRHDVETWGRAFPAFLKWGWRDKK